MVDVKKVPVDLLLKELSRKLSEDMGISKPDWTQYLKAGVHREKSWDDDNWYYIRLASILRKLYLRGRIGISRLSSEYGGPVDSGSKRYHPSRGSRFIIRDMFHTLENLGLVAKQKEGRGLTAAGQKLLNEVAKEILTKLAETNPELKKYL